MRRRTLALIVLLDQAKEEGLLPADPCLFRAGRETSIKTSKDMVIEFARQYVSGTTADLPKVLQQQGAQLRHEQKPLHECAAPPRPEQRPSRRAPSLRELFPAQVRILRQRPDARHA